ncbi:MAG: Gfo/Idh/MocA family protein [Fimbriimonadaceae bacterium]
MAITIAVLGTGSIGTRHYNCLTQNEGVTPVAVPTRPERVAELQSQGIYALDQVPDEAVGIVIATDTARHLSDWQQYQDRFCLVEKPLTGDITPELESLVAQTQGRAFTACVLRHNLTLSEFKQYIELENMPPMLAMIRCSSYLPDWRPNRDYRKLYSAQPGQGGALRELIHEVDYAGWIFGWPDEIDGEVSPATSIEIADEESARFTFHNSDGSVNISLDIASNESSRTILADYGSHSIQADLIDQSITFTTGERQETLFYKEPRDAMYTRQLEAFIRATQGKISEPLATAEEGLKALRVIEAVRLSSATGHPVNL